MILKRHKVKIPSLQLKDNLWQTLLEWYPLWLLIFVGFTTWIALPTWKVSRYQLKEGQVASEDVVIPMDLEVVDEQATLKKQEQAKDRIPPVFDYNPAFHRLLMEKVSAFFAEGRKNPKITQYPDLSIPKTALTAFQRHNFSETLESLILSLIAKVYQKPVVANKAYLMSLHQIGYYQNTLTTDQEVLSYDVFGPRDFPQEVESLLDGELESQRKLKRKDRLGVKAFLMANIQPNLSLDLPATEKRREEAASRIQKIAHTYPAGYILLRRGEKVTPQTEHVLRVLERQLLATRSFYQYGGTFLLSLLAAWFYILVVQHRQIRLYGESESKTLSVMFILSVIFLAFIKGGMVLLDHLSLFMTSPIFTQKGVLYTALPFGLGASVVQLIGGYPMAVAYSLVFAHFSGLISGDYATFFPYVLAGSLALIFSLHSLRSRQTIFRAGFWLFMTNFIMILIFHLLTPGKPQVIVLFSLWGMGGLGAFVTALFISFFAPLIEVVFGVTTDLRLLELASANHPLLKELSLTAPGTYVHSSNMAMLAEQAAEKIHANALLARVACLFHDIGKMKMPHYFVENQQGYNPHQEINPGVSKAVLKNHIQVGVDLAKQHRLPRPILDAILQHHGTKVMHYFYERAKEKEESPLEDTDYRYPGPRPQTKEMGIVLLADTIEAASRSLEEYSPAKFRSLVHLLIQKTIADEQLSDSPLTLKELALIEDSFVQTLTRMYHARIAYPGFELDKPEGAIHGDKPSDNPKPS